MSDTNRKNNKMKKPQNLLNEIDFDIKDTAIFNISDTRTRLDTLQKYFFPRLELLLRDTLSLIQDIYQVNPWEKTTSVYTPSHRKKAQINRDLRRLVYVGISYKRVCSNQYLIIKNKLGKPYSYHTSYLTYWVEPNGSLQAMLSSYQPLDVAINKNFFCLLRKIIDKNFSLISRIMTLNHIAYGWDEFIDLNNIFKSNHLDNWDSYDFLFKSPLQYFPINYERGIKEIKLAFTALYPLFEAFSSIEKGDCPEAVSLRLADMLNKYKEWHLAGGLQKLDQLGNNVDDKEPLELPELDSYSFIRTGLWWQVLAQDKWRCCSCGRSAKDGITLHVDHIIPRSLGGTDTLDNLQTLCWKCNIGKSNKDNTNLRI